MRDAIRWPLVDLGRGRYDFSSLEPMVHAARRHGIEVIWDLFHYGYPVGVELLSDAFAERFADYCAACARFLRSRQPGGTLWFTPVNEPSFFSWAGGHDAQFAPHLRGQDYALKIALVRAAIRGIDAIRAEVRDVRFLNADPLCRVVPPDDRPESLAAARHFNEVGVYEAWDMLCGRLLPELGGSRAHLDVVGINYYWTCQWEQGQHNSFLAANDARRLGLPQLVRQVWDRYGGDLMISETMHWGDQRPGWMLELGDDIEQILGDGVPLAGVCLYPILSMQNWHAPRDWTSMGLWDLDCHNGMCRVLHQPMLERFLQVQRRLQPWLQERQASVARA